MTVGIGDRGTDRSAQSLALEDAREQRDAVSLTALSGQRRLTGTTTVESALELLQVDSHTGRNAVDNPADSRAVTLSKCGQTIYSAKSVHISRKKV